MTWTRTVVRRGRGEKLHRGRLLRIGNGRDEGRQLLLVKVGERWRRGGEVLKSGEEVVMMRIRIGGGRLFEYPVKRFHWIQTGRLGAWIGRETVRTV